MVALQTSPELIVETNDKPCTTPPGQHMVAPPGMHLAPPPGLQSSPVQTELEVETQRLQEAHQQLVKERLELETARMAHENALLRAQLQYNVLAAAAPFPVVGGRVGAPVMPPGCWAKSAPGFARKSSHTSQCSTQVGSDSSEEEKAAETTILVRNIPNSYTRERFISLLNAEGFQSLYDLVYLPIDFTSRSGYGYAFINFVSEQAAQQFRDHFEGFNEWGVFSEKTCDATGVAAHQGLDANIQRYRNSPMMHESVPDEFRPVIFKDGARIPFPAPTRKIRAPDVRQGLGKMMPEQ